MKEYLRRMEGLASNGDIEADHGHADDLLVEILRNELLPILGDGNDIPRLKQLLDLYEQVRKWYA